MIRVIVVDDEKVIREGIGRFVKETKGFELLQTCANGDEAFRQIQAHCPDLVICDVVMPVCDGIELIRRCREAAVESEFVLLSGYSEFEYARAGIRYGVLDYINKPVKRAAFQKVLENARDVVEKKSDFKKILQLNAYKKAMESGSDRETEEFLPDGFPQRVLVVNCTGGIAGDPARKMTEEALKYCESFMKKEALEEYIVYSKEGLVVLVLTGADTKEENVEKICGKLQRSVSGGYPVYIGIGSLTRSMQGIPVSYKKARAAMYEAQCRGKIRCSFEKLSYSYESPAKFYAMDISDVIHAFHLGDLVAAQCETERLAAVYCKTLPPYVAYSFVKKCAQEVMECTEGLTNPEQMREGQNNLADLVTATSLDTLLERFGRIISMANKSYCQEGKNEKYGGTMDEVINYIHLHYTDEISIKKICEVFYFNPNYFSSLFKTKTGLNYNDYITELRMKKAKELLQSGQYRISEIADLVGYNSPRYFSKVFKAKIGELPQEYKTHRMDLEKH